MSLILEALKKVERERTAPEQRGFLVLGPASWAPTRSNAGWILGMLAAASVAGGAVYLLTRPAPVAEPPAPPAARTTPETLPSAAETTAAETRAWEPPPPATLVPRARASTPAAPTIVAAALVLHAISEQDGVPVAVINERVVREGQVVDGVRVVRIGAAEVEVEAGGVRRILRF